MTFTSNKNISQLSIYLMKLCCINKLMPNSESSKILKSRQLKATHGRIAVLDSFLTENTALSHADLELKLKETDVNRVTIYRILDCFVEKNILHKVSSEQANQLFALNKHQDSIDNQVSTHKHAHFICDKCEKIECFDLPTNVTEQQVYTKIGYAISSIDITVHGFCKNCSHFN